MRFPVRRFLGLFLFGLVAGLLGEGALLMRAHCLRAEFLLLEDFRLLAFLSGEAGEGRRKLAEERLQALPATDKVRYVSPQESLAEIEADHPDIGRSVALLGDNPLPGVLEVQIRPDRFSGLDGWLKAAGAVPDVTDILYKPLQVQAITQVQFYSRYLSLLLSLAACLWALGLAWALWSAGPRLSGTRTPSLAQALGSSGEAAARAAACGGGAFLGAGLSLLLAAPAAAGGLRAWPSPWLQAVLVLGAAAGGAFLARRSPGGGGERPFLFFRRTGKAASLLLSAVLLPVPGRSFGAALTNQKAELKELNQTLEQKKKELEVIREKEAALHKDLSELNAQEDRSQRRVQEIESRREETRRKTDLLSGRLDAIHTTHGGERAVLAAEIVDYARHLRKRFGYYGTDETWEESLRRAALLEKTSYLAKLRLIGTRTAAEHEQARREDEDLRRRARAAHVALRSHRSRLQVTETEYRRAKRAVSFTRREIRELEESARALANLLRNAERVSVRRGRKTAKTPSIAKHSLPWPVEGEVLSTFGKERASDLDTWIIRNGIEIAAGPGISVSPVARGTVIFAGPFRSYGNTVILDHGGGFYSIYGKLGHILRQKGESVRFGQELARVAGDEGGGRVYFELRQGDAALNPAVWLQKR